MYFKPYLDARDLDPTQRHGFIFRAFRELGPGEWFILIHDHDPRPLHDQFIRMLTGQFAWEYLEQGPLIWRIRITKAGFSASDPL